ncbi:MAG: class I SAM-dependent methyltransferase [Methylophilaceae bacterium]
MTDINQALQNALQLANSGQLDAARQACQQILTTSPQHAETLNLLQQIEFRLHMMAAQQRFPGKPYLEWLEWFHLARQPKTYLEIGVETGNSIRFAKPPTKAIGVDPEFNIAYTQQTWSKLFRETSNDFFAAHDLREVMQADAIDLAFIDGLHTFDQTLTDFINVERYSDKDSLVIFHDIFPVSPITASRERKSVLWLGDTWKVILILRKFRPDLQLFTIPTYPSGLAVVSNLDCHSTVLSDRYEEIIGEFMPLAFEQHQATFESQLNLVTNEFQAVEQALTH